MYKVLVVDDDGIVRLGLSKNIDWKKNNCNLVGTAGNGKKALEMISQMRPHIVISDIKMPFMNGLEMTKKISENYPEIKVILLSGYEDFNYAKEAIECRVCEYLLKPIDNDKLLDTVKKAIREIENETKVERQIRESIPLLRQVFLNRLIEGKYKKEEDILSEIDFLNVPLYKGAFITVAIKIDDYNNPTYCKEVMERELLKFSILNISEEILQNNCQGVAFDHGGDLIVMILNGEIDDKETISEKAYEISEGIRKNMKELLKTTVTIGVGMPYVGFSEISKSFTEACAAVEFRHILGKNQVLSVQDTGLPYTDNYINSDEKIKDLLLNVKLSMTEKALHIVEDLKQQLTGESFVPLFYVQMLGVEIATALLKGMGEWSKDETIKNEGHKFYDIYKEIYQLETINEIFDKIGDLVVKISQCINADRTSHQKKIVDKAIEYIHLYYKQEKLSLLDVAQHVHISPTYLSIIFKKEKDINFLDYILDFRMKKAMELLRDKDLKTYEVAQEVGYNNPQYFSVCFKKATGYSPSEFKKY